MNGNEVADYFRALGADFMQKATKCLKLANDIDEMTDEQKQAAALVVEKMGELG